jgi:hypothetical protein
MQYSRGKRVSPSTTDAGPECPSSSTWSPTAFVRRQTPPSGPPRAPASTISSQRSTRLRKVILTANGQRRSCANRASPTCSQRLCWTGETCWRPSRGQRPGTATIQRSGAVRVFRCVLRTSPVNGLCFCRSFIAGMPDPSWRGLTRVMAGTLPCVMAGTLPCRVTALALRSNTCWLSSVPARRTCSTRPPMALRPAHGAVLVHRLRAG